MWTKSLSNCIKIMQYDDDRKIGLELKVNNYILLFLCIYLPYDCDRNLDD